MPQIRPVSDLRNHFSEISRIVHESKEPVFLTKNGYGDMVVMSIEQYENIQQNQEIIMKLKEAEHEADTSKERYSHSEVIDNLRMQIRNRTK
ncbi:MULTISPECIES: type II toxin-antitoxin system Phd/YefM family antitoxin [unclassified Paenibacillus]|uniref:type II toxin-antitoxin system Phd/YefM family antitoxin n=1 Tax=unclassified Paenibacillus TaxID=185978 RepID=UPI00096C8B46|nr:prevent-host-death protein [Paenibacillus sp. FSL R7-0333]